MGSTKRYYWLKFKEDFFDSKRIKKLRKLAGGDTYTIIYLKMQLQSLKTGGVLEYTGLEDTFAKEIALDIDEDADNVTITVNYLLSCGLMEASENNFILPFVKECTGSEDANTQRVREYRKRQQLLQSNYNVTTMKQVGNVEKDIDKEKEKEEILSNTIDDIDLLLSDKTIYHVAQEDVEKWHSLYPDVDIISELKKMSGWLYVNISRRKTKRGIKSFINKWLSRNQDDFNANNKKRQMPNYDDEVVEVDNPEEERRKLIAQFKAANSK